MSRLLPNQAQQDLLRNDFFAYLCTIKKNIMDTKTILNLIVKVLETVIASLPDKKA